MTAQIPCTDKFVLSIGTLILLTCPSTSGHLIKTATESLATSNLCSFLTLTQNVLKVHGGMAIAISIEAHQALVFCQHIKL